MTTVATVGVVIAVTSGVNWAGAKVNNFVAYRRYEPPPADVDELRAAAWLSIAGVATAAVAQLVQLAQL